MEEKNYLDMSDDEFFAELGKKIESLPKAAQQLFFIFVRCGARVRRGIATAEQREMWTIGPSEFIKRHGQSKKDRRDFYYRYIASPEWRKKADEAKRRAGYRCQVCNRGRDEVTLNAHHRTYKNLGNEKAEDLTVLCTGCHDTFHKAGKIARID